MRAFTYVFLVLVVLSFQKTLAQVTFVIDKLPENTAEADSIFITGDFDGWSGGQAAYQLSQKNGRFFITIPQQQESIQFKFTQGSWDTVETDANGKQIENRTYKFVNQLDTVHIQIANWNTVTEKKSTATKNVSILSEAFEMPQLQNRTRRIWIYLPPDYETSQKKYPVLYMHDGQNLFDDVTSFSGEWQLDETLNRLFEEKNIGIIVIGIDNGGDKRIDEYSPWKNEKYGGGEGDLYLEFMVETLKPYVDSNFRTLSNKKNTGLFGSSMGAFISHYGGLKYPNVFGKIGVFSPSFWFSNSSFDFAKSHSNLIDTKMYFLAGDQEGEEVIPDMEKMIAIMTQNGFAAKNISSKIIQREKHNEQLWATNFSDAVLWLFEK
jgi:alpha-glucosidase